MKFKQVSVFLRHEHCPKSWEKPGYFCPLILLLKLRKWDKLPWAGAFLSQFSCKKLINYAFSYSVKVAPYDYLSETSKCNKLFCALNSYRSSRMNSKSYKIIARENSLKNSTISLEWLEKQAIFLDNCQTKLQDKLTELQLCYLLWNHLNLLRTLNADFH